MYYCRGGREGRAFRDMKRPCVSYVVIDGRGRGRDHELIIVVPVRTCTSHDRWVECMDV